MGFAALLALAGLALVDSTSIGTLVVPLWMLVHPQLRARMVVLYLAVIGLFYWILGVGLLGGASILADRWAAIEASTLTHWTQLIIGSAMLVGSFWPDTPWAKRRAARRGTSGPRARWRERVAGERASAPAVAGVALVAGLIEAASMLPYLGAVGLLSTTGLGLPARAGVLAAYVLIMCAPALVLLGLRVLLDDRIRPRLARIEAWVTRRSGGALWWVVGLLGFFLARDALGRLGIWGSVIGG